MPSRSQIDLHFPIAGVNRAAGFQSQPPFSCVDARNVLPFDAHEGRARGGSRPGLRKAFYNDLGNAVRLLTAADFTQTGTHRIFTDDFDSDSLGSMWEAIGSISLIDVIDEYAAVTEDQEAAAALTSLGLDTASDYSVGIYIAPYDHAFHGIYRIYLRMDSTPDPTDEGAIIEVGMLGDAIVATLLSYTGGVETVVDTYFGLPQSYADGNWLRVFVDVSEPDVYVYWGATEILSGEVDAHTGQRMGFGATCLDPSGRCIIEQFRAAYFVSGAPDKAVRKLFAASSGSLYREDNTTGDMHEMTANGAGSLASDNNLMAVQYGRQLYIADHSDVIAEGTDGVDGGSTTTFDSATYADWTALGNFSSDPTAYVLVITSATGDIIVGTYPIASVTINLVTTTTAFNTGTSGTCTFYIARGPKRMDANGTSILQWTATYGQVPTGSKVIARYRERAVLAVDTNWFMSRQGSWNDWYYGRSYEDPKRAIAGTFADAGVPGDVITALANSNDDYLTIGCLDSTWMIVGDPAYTGQIRCVSETVGFVGAKAWCHGPESQIYHLSRGGLARIDGPGATPRLLGIGKIPRELLNVNADLYTVSLAYDLNEHRVFIFITDPDTNRSGRHWCYDVRTDSFWPLFFPASIQPTSAFYYTSQLPGDSCVMLGCRDGYVRRMDRYCDTDDGNSFDSYVVYGPIANASGGEDGMLDWMIADVALLSRDVSWELRVGQNAERAFRNDAATSGTWVDGENHTDRPQRRGNAFTLKVGRFSSVPAGWGMERITVGRKALGHRRN